MGVNMDMYVRKELWVIAYLYSVDLEYRDPTMGRYHSNNRRPREYQNSPTAGGCEIEYGSGPSVVPAES